MALFGIVKDNLTKPKAKIAVQFLSAVVVLCGVSGCATMNELGVAGMDPSLDTKFTGICSVPQTKGAVYEDQEHNLFRVNSYNEFQIHMNVLLRPNAQMPALLMPNGQSDEWAVKFDADYNLDKNRNLLISRNSTLGATVRGTTPFGLQGDTSLMRHFEFSYVHPAAMKLISDAYYNATLPPQICSPGILAKFSPGYPGVPVRGGSNTKQFNYLTGHGF